LREGADLASTTLGTLRPYFRLDVPIVAFAIVFIVLFAPLIPRNTDNPQLLAAYANDEPFLTMALEATLVPPYGNPGAYFDQKNSASRNVPERWGDKRYFNITYYGGAMFELAFPFYATLRVAGLPPFPTGPIILRTLTLLAALLSLLVLYNIAKERGSLVAGLAAGVFLVSDGYFLYYANFIHPDTLQMLFGLCAFLLAVAHARDGTRSTLLALGLFCGIVQGTKSGGPWTVPMAVLAVWLGLRAVSTAPRARTVRRTASRVALLGVAALIGFFVTTPYAFLDTYYARSMHLAYQTVTRDSLQQSGAGPLLTWSKALYEYVGPVGALLIAATVGRAVWAARRGTPDTPLNLTLVLALSQFLWYGAAGRLWQVVGYLLLSLGLMSVFAFESVHVATRKLVAADSPLRLRPRVRRLVPAAVVGLAATALVAGRWYTPTTWELDQYASSRSTVRVANEWAVEYGVSPRAVIVYDDLAYFDRRRFPNARLHGGVLTWRDVGNARPDYVVLSSSLFGASWMQNLIATQRLTRTNPDPFNVRLYQDLLRTQSPGPTSVPGVRLEAVLRAHMRRPASALADWASACGRSAVCDRTGLDGQLRDLAAVETRFRAVAGDANPIVGPELRIFRLDRQRLTQSRS
jgi:hypothetical protein